MRRNTDPRWSTPTVKQMYRVALAFVVSPAIGLLILDVLLSWDSGRVTGLFAGGGAIFAYPSALLFGVPLFIYLRRINMLGWWSASLGGVMAGVPAWLVLIVLGYGTKNALKDSASGLFMVTLVGAVSGCAFWVIGVWRNDALTGRSIRLPAASTERRR